MIPKVGDYIANEAEPEVFDFDYPEDVLFLVSKSRPRADRFWGEFEIVEIEIIHSKEDVIGAATYEQAYGCFLEYTIEGIIEPISEEGYFVIEGVTGYYSRGDGWHTDDDMEFYHVCVRPATIEEVADHYGGEFWDTLD